MPFYLDDPAESRQEQETNSTAEQGPTRRPNALHHGADVGKVQQKTRRDSHRSCQQEFLERNLGSRFPKPPSRNQTQNHGAERRNEAQRQVAAFIVNPS